MWTKDQIIDPGSVRWLRSPTVLLILALLSLAIAFLLTGHGNHLVDALLYVPFAACLLAHLFMHQGHNHQRQSDKR